MAKVKKMADGGISSLDGLLSSYLVQKPPPAPTLGGSGGGGGGAREGLNRVNQGSDEIGKALGQASSALSQASSAIGDGGGGNTPMPPFPEMKKGGSVTSKKYADKNGRLNLGSGRVSTAQKNPKQPKW